MVKGEVAGVLLYVLHVIVIPVKSSSSSTTGAVQVTVTEVLSLLTEADRPVTGALAALTVGDSGASPAAQLRTSNISITIVAVIFFIVPYSKQNANPLVTAKQ